MRSACATNWSTPAWFSAGRWRCRWRTRSVRLDCGYRLDLVVEETVVVELKTVDHLLPVHEAQLLTYLKLYGSPVGLLINFNVPVLKEGLKRLVNNFPEGSASPRLRGE